MAADDSSPRPGPAVTRKPGNPPLQPNRRAWLRGAGACAALAACDALWGAEEAAPPAPRPPQGAALLAAPIDAHVHVWTPNVRRFPLAAGFAQRDMQPPSFTPEELFGHSVPAGVGRVVLIQMSYYRFDNAYLLDALRRYPGVFSGVAVIDEHAPRPADTMRELARQGVRGFRLHPGQQAVEKWISSPGMAAMWRCGADQRLAMCCLVNPEALPAIDRMCAQHPDTPVVIDHFGRIGIDGTIRQPDLQNLCRLARHGSLRVKISAYYALGNKRAPYADLVPMIRRLCDAFGPRRLMWASDAPFQVENGHRYRDSLALVRERLDFVSAADRDWLLRDTAAETFFR